MPHPDSTHPELMLGCKVTELLPAELRLEFVVVGDLTRLQIPAATAGQRTDSLWQHTCFEAFLAQSDGSYWELNLAPSGDWASYRFDGYREGMTEAAGIVVELVEFELGEKRLAVTAKVSGPMRTNMLECRLALSAVIEELDGTKSYWALAHPPGKPDFHHPACFTATLPPPITP